MTERVLQDGLSEDGLTFTKFVEDDGSVDNDQSVIVDMDDGDTDSVTALMKKIDVSALPEDQKVLFNKLQDELKDRLAETDSLKTQTGTVEVLKQIAAQLSDLRSPQKVDADADKPKKKLAESFKFADDDYYAPFFKQLASAVDLALEKMEGTEKSIQDGRRVSFQKEVVNFIKQNKVPSKVVAKMDEIAREDGPGVYNNLERLLRTAKSELGIKDVPSEKPRIRRENVFEFSGKKRSNATTDDKPAKTMAEAWAKAEEQLAETVED